METPGGTFVSSWGAFKFYFWELAKVLIISLAIIIPVRYFLIQPFYVKGASMEPTLDDHEYLIINELGYRLGDPQRGDIVVFHYPLNTTEYFIKRVIGLPNERVKIENGIITIFAPGSLVGTALTESYLSSAVQTLGVVDMQLGADEFFVLGDNRPYSLDSRRFGPVKKGYIVGKAWLRGWPFNRLGVFSTPSY